MPRKRGASKARKAPRKAGAKKAKPKRAKSGAASSRRGRGTTPSWEPRPCGACGEEADEDGDDPILQCFKCGDCVHQGCYGCSDADVRASMKHEWQCDPCVAGVQSPRCELCPVQGNRVMRQGTRAGKAVWVHVTCALWVPEVFFENCEKLQNVTGFQYIAKDRFKLKCKVCGVKEKTTPIQCAVPSCVTAFHPLCARKMKWQMDYVETGSGEPRLKAYCEAHSEASPEDIQCEVCKSPKDADSMLLCDECDHGYHMACLDPPLTELPAGDDDWFCPPCVQVQLLKGTIIQVVGAPTTTSDVDGDSDFDSDVPAIESDYDDSDAAAGAAAQAQQKQAGRAENKGKRKRRGTGSATRHGRGAGGAGAGAGAGATSSTRGPVTRKTRYVALTDEFVASLPAPAALVSSDEEEEDSEGDEDVTGGAADSDSGDSDAGQARPAKRARKNDGDEDGADVMVGYFTAQKTKPVSSGTTLESLPMIDTPGELQQVLRGVAPKHTAEIAVLHHHYRLQFPKWALQLHNGFSLLFYGLGSKRTLLQEFVASVAGRHAVVEVNGYMPWFNIKTLLSTITSKMLWNSRSFSSVVEHAHFVANCFASTTANSVSGTKRSGYGVATEQDDTEDLDNEDGGAVLPNGTIMVPASASKKQRLGGSGVVGHDSDEEWHNDAVGEAVASDTAVTSSAKHLYILLHNLDGPALRSADAQTALSVLAAAGRIHVAASVDHVNASLLLDQRQRQRGNWVWHDITTYSRYSEETAFLESVLSSRKELNFDRLSFVLQSLTPNHRAVLRILAQHHVDEQDTPGMLFRTYCQACMDDMLVSSDQGFRHLMVELQDHDLVAVRRGLDNRGDSFYVPLSDAMIAQMLDLLVRWKD